MANTGEGILGTLVGDILMGVLELLVEDPANREDTDEGELGPETDVAKSIAVDERIIGHRETAGAAGHDED